MRHDILADMFSAIKNAEIVGKSHCIVKPTSKLMKSILEVMKKEGYIVDFKHIENNSGGMIKVTLKGRINNCRVIKPQHSLKKNEYEKWEKRYLPASGVGALIISTPKGVLMHEEAKGKYGGILLAYVY